MTSLRPAVVFPNVERLLVNYLDGRLDVPVRADVPSTRPPAWVMVRRVGGVARSDVIDEALVAVEAWATSPSTAHDLAQEARAEIHAVAGAVVLGTTFYLVRDAGGPANLPDPDSRQARYTFTVTVGLRGDSL